MKKKYIIGSGGFAKEVFFLLESVYNLSDEFGGFIDYKPTQSTIVARGYTCNVLDEDHFLENIKPDDSIELFIGIGDPKTIYKVTQKFNKYVFPNLIHPNLISDKKSISLGQGNIITSGCTFTVDIQIGSFNIFNLHTTIGHDVNIGNCNVFNPGCNISGSVIIQDKNLFGTNSSVLQGIQIGSNNTLGASALATKSFENNLTMVGIPAKPLNK